MRRRRARNLFNITYEEELAQFLFCAAGHWLRSQGTDLLTSALFATMRSLPSNTNMAPTPSCLNSENSRCQPVMGYVGEMESRDYQRSFAEYNVPGGVRTL